MASDHTTTEELALENLSSQLKHRDQQIEELQNKLSSGTEAYNRLLSQFEHDSHQRQEQEYEWVGAIDGLDSEVERLETKLAQRDRELADLKSDNASLSSQVEQLNEDVRKLQQTAFNALDNARWMPMDNDTVSSEFSKLRKGINNIAKANAVEDFGALANHTDESRHSLRQLLDGVVTFRSEEIGGLDELAAIRHGPRLCLCSIISNFMHEAFLDRPFFLLDPVTDDGGDREIIAGRGFGFSKVYNRGRRGQYTSTYYACITNR